LNLPLNSIVAALICGATLSACAGLGAGVKSATKEDDKDPLFTYDGRYALEVDHPGGRQQLTGNWFINCSPRKFRNIFSVKNSEVSYKLGEEATVKGYVDRDGRFRLSRVMDWKTGVSGGIASDGQTSAVVQGILRDDVMSGRLLFAQREHSGLGCSYPITYEKL
jgi:hypothetical protein